MDDADFMESTHGKVGCVICHGGLSTEDDKDTAHIGLIADPSESDCNTCHADIAHANALSLHTTLSGFTSALEARGGNLEEGSPLATAFDNHCAQCHTSCGQCHVSRPDEMGGGLVSDHKFRKIPSTLYNCTACHGSRIGDEYLGGNEGIAGDIHWTQEGMICMDCHDDELHGSGELATTRYQNESSASCDDCHQDIWANTETNPQHEQHLGDLSCQVCHSIEYKNCYSCHVGIDDEGLPCRTSAPSEITFKIGLNPVRSEDRPFEYVVLRHVPICEDICTYYGDNLLPDFDELPTWKFATPHNIQLHTPQNEDCNSCHGNIEYFLTEEDVNPEELEANKDVIVDDIPPKQ